jgi:hypothetical protein
VLAGNGVLSLAGVNVFSFFSKSLPSSSPSCAANASVRGGSNHVHLRSVWELIASHCRRVWAPCRWHRDLQEVWAHDWQTFEQRIEVLRDGPILPSMQKLLHRHPGVLAANLPQSRVIKRYVEVIAPLDVPGERRHSLKARCIENRIQM